MFGRAAMGEAVEQGALTDRWRVRRGGRLVFAETVRLDGAIAQKLAEPAVAGGGVAVATVLVAPADDAMVERVRAHRTFLWRGRGLGAGTALRSRGSAPRMAPACAAILRRCSTRSARRCRGSGCN